ncbi:UbiA family prenyltransferase [bacterium]|nr:UbiA family prenyltransferase [bacterium]
MWFVRKFLVKPEFQTINRQFSLSSFQFQLFILDVLLVAIIGYWLNDWFDRDIDKINKPNRFLVKNPLSRTKFWMLIGSTSIIATTLSLYLAKITNHLNDLWILPVTLLSVGVYAIWLKRFKPIGNILVSLLIVSLIALVLVSENILNPLSYAIDAGFYQKIGLYASLIFVINMSREIVKDIEDLKGDQELSVVSIPSILGVNRTKNLVITLLIFSILLELIYVWSDLITWIEIMAIGLLLLLHFGCIWMLKSSIKPSDFRQLSTLLKWLMSFGILQLAILSNW